jgi:hypothetical protein
MTRGATNTLSDEFMFEGFAQLTMFENDGNHWPRRAIPRSEVGRRPRGAADSRDEPKAGKNIRRGEGSRACGAVEPGVQRLRLGERKAKVRRLRRGS